MPSDSNVDRELSLDEAVLAYLKAREGNPQLDQKSWMELYPDLQAELTDFFSDQNRLDQLANILRLVGDAESTAISNENTAGWNAKQGESREADLPGNQVLGDYEILQVIGKGGMGRVYKARQRSLKRIVALKMILTGLHAGKEELQRFRSEAEAVAMLQHPNIVQIFEVGELDGMPFFSLEYVDGGSLASQLNGTPLPTRTAAELMRTLAKTIQFAHQQGIIHRDLKPANVLLSINMDRQGTATKITEVASKGSSGSLAAPRQPVAVAKITDFGLAKRLDDDSGQTKSGTIMGTPSYMAPEQAAGDRHRVGPATDVYGLGAILYELITGRPPFKAATPWETVTQVLNNEVASPHLLDSAVDRDIETICLKCLQKDPQRRYESAQALADDLQLYLEGKPILARPIPGVVKFWRMCRRHPATATSLALALGALLVLMVTIVLFNGRLQQELAQNEAINHALLMSQTRQVADRIDSEIRQLTRIPTLLATTLAHRADWPENQLETWLRDALATDKRLFGVAVAFEPQQFDGKRDDFCMYAFHSQNQIKTKLLLLPDYQPHYREHAWYKNIQGKKVAIWSEPFLDIEGGDVPMVTYSTPIWRGGKFVGVVTADLSIAYFDAMRQWLDEVNLGKHGYAFVVSPSGTFISHPDKKFQMPKKLGETQSFQSQADLQELTKRMLNRETGFVRAVDPSTGKKSIFYFAPIASSQWSFCAVTEE